jgi:tetratricopeptide (TPR) repeat protein
MVDVTRHIEKADEAARKRNFDYAIELFQQILEMAPGSAPAFSGLRDAAVKRLGGKAPGAGALFKAAMPRARISAMQAMKKHDAIAKACAHYLAINPYDRKVSQILGESALALGHEDVAILAFEGIEPVGGSSSGQKPDLSALRSLGLLYQRKNEFEKALATFEKVLRIDPNDVEASRARKNIAAEMAIKSSRIDTATSSRDLIKDKRGAQELEDRQKLTLTDDEREAALAAAEAAWQAAPGDRKTAVDFAKLLDRTGDVSRAIEVLEGVPEGERDAEALSLLGDLQIREIDFEIRRWREAAIGDESAKAKVESLLKTRTELEVKECRRRVEAQPTDLGLRFRLGDALVRSGDVDLAIGEFQQTVKDPSKRPESLVRLGDCFATKSLFDLAAKQYEKALETLSDLSPRTLDVRYHLATVLERQGNSARALEEYSKIFEKDIQFKDVSKKMEALQKRASGTDA